MTKPMRRFTFFVCAVVGMFVLSGLAQAQDIVVGVMGGIPNNWSTDQQNERLKEWKDAGVHVIRAGIAPNDKGIDIAKLIYDHGVKIDWMPRLQYRPDAPKQPYRKEFPNMWAGPPLSALDPDGFRAYFQSNLDNAFETEDFTLTGYGKFPIKSGPINLVADPSRRVLPRLMKICLQHAGKAASRAG